jgi:GT2 family glycosyltransferase
VRTLAVVVPTFRRPEALSRCLDALDAQHRAPDELVVVTRTGDPSVGVARGAGIHRIVELDVPGVLAAMVAGVRATSAEVVCFTDDDAVAPPTWTGRLDAAIGASDRIGGVGGRDVVHQPDGSVEHASTARVGELAWYGRHVGNHHLGVGRPRDVAFLKGVNAAYRRAALGLPTGLRGEGAQVHFEVAVGRYAREHGWTLRYDPSIVVDHYPAERQGADQRTGASPRAIADASYNLVVAMGRSRGLTRVAYATVLGDRGSPGLVRAAVALCSRDAVTASRLWPSVRGTVAGGSALLRGDPVGYETFD